MEPYLEWEAYPEAAATALPVTQSNTMVGNIHEDASALIT